MDNELETSINANPSTGSNSEGATSNASAFNYATRTNGITQSNHYHNETRDQAIIISGRIGNGAAPCNTTTNQNTASGKSTQLVGTASDATVTHIFSGRGSENK